ncbi:MAG: hypothetical protein NC548_30735 [Lachnospiraceae bacterium]|nr:hypothetical protein [Lachnospiraceae bacterium]
MTQSIEQLYAALNTKFVEQRTLTEVEVNKFLRSVEELDPVFQQQIGVVQGQTARDVLPSLWSEPFDESRYLQERAAVEQRIQLAAAICDKLNEEALKCLQDSQ